MQNRKQNLIKNLTVEYPKADLTRIETLKQIVINKFKENGLSFSKIRSSKIKDKAYRGIYIYHPNGSLYYQSKREIVSETENTKTYRKYRKKYRVNFISTENLEEFTNFLNMVLVESLQRMEGLNV